MTTNERITMVQASSKTTSHIPAYQRLLRNVFQLQDDEVPRVVLMFLYSLLAIGAFILGRIVRDALLLALPPAQGVQRLPFLMAVAAIAVSLTSYIYSRYANRLRRDQMILLINGLLLFLLLLLYLALVVTPASWQPTVLQINYVYIELMGALQVIQFWTFASELFDPRAAKRSFAIIGGGAVLANLLAFGVRPMVKLLEGAQHLLPLLGVMLGLCMLVVYWIGRQNRQTLIQLHRQKQQTTSSRRAIRMGDTERIWKHRQLTTIALIIVFTFFTTTLIDYQFKALAAQLYKDTESLSHYFSMFYGITGIFACIVQFGLAGRILERWGIRLALLLLPIALFGTSFLLATAPLLLSSTIAFTLAKGSENVLRYTVNDVSLNLLYVPVSTRLRARAKAFIDGILKPAAIGLCAGFIFFLRSAQWKIQHLSFLAMGFLVIWIVLIFQAHREYVATLLKSMQKNRLDLEKSSFSIQDDSAVQALRSVLQSDDENQIIYALDLLPHISHHPWQRDLLPLLEHPSQDVCVKALCLLGQLHPEQNQEQFEDLLSIQILNQELQDTAERIASLLQHPSPQIRAQAIETFCALLGDEAIGEVADFLDDPSPEVQAATIVGLIQHGGLEGILQAAEPLKHLLENEEATLRNHGAHILGRLGARNFYRPLLRLLQDPDPTVQTSAIKAAGQVRSPKLAQTLFDLLGQTHTARSASDALFRYGASLIPLVRQHLNPKEASRSQKELIRLLGRFANQEALDVLLDHLKQVRWNGRQHVLHHVHRLLTQTPGLHYDQERIEHLLFEELQIYYEYHLFREVIEEKLATSDALSDAIREQQAQGMEHIFRALGLLYPMRQIQLISLQLREGDSRLRANAIELLDNLLRPETKRILLPLLERNDMLTTLASERFQLSAPTLREIFDCFTQETTPWLHACVLWTLQQNQRTQDVDLAIEALQHPNALLRETALLTIHKLLPSEEFQEYLPPFFEDPDVTVRQFAYHHATLYTRSSSELPTPQA